MNPRDDNDLVDIEGLDELTALYRDSRAQDRPQPPPALDARIRDAARRSAGPTAPRRLFDRRWRAPLAMAALLVLGIGLVSLMQQQIGYRPSPPLPSKTHRESAETLVPVAPELRRKTPLRPAAEPAPPILRSRQPEPSRENAESFAADEESVVEPSAIRVPADSLSDESDRAQELKIESEATPGAGATRAPATVPAPEVWLRQIEELRRQGRDQEADIELRLFRVHYPDYPPASD